MSNFIDNHLLVYTHVTNESTELFEVDLAVVVLVGKLDGLVHDLLELRVLQVGAYHLEKLKQLAVADVAVVVDVVNSERDSKAFKVLHHTAGLSG